MEKHASVDKALRPERELFSPSTIKGTVLPFLGRFALFFAILAAPWPGLALTYTEVFAGLANTLLPSSEDNVGMGEVRLSFEPAMCAAPANARNCWTSELVVKNRRTERDTRIPLDTRALSFIPIITFLSLGLASSLRGLRRNFVLIGGGLLLIGVVAALFSALPVLWMFAAAGVLSTHPVVAKATALLYEALVSPGTAYIAPALVWWAMLTLTRNRRRASSVEVGGEFAVR